MNISKYKLLQMSETIMHILFFTAACVSVLAVGLICVFLFANGFPAIQEIGLLDFLAGETDDNIASKRYVRHNGFHIFHGLSPSGLVLVDLPPSKYSSTTLDGVLPTP